MSKLMLALLLLVELLSLFLLVRLLRSNRGFVEKIALSVMLVVPFVGPLIYFFLIEDIPAQHPFLRNTGARGEYMHRMISFQAKLNNSHAPPDDAGEENSLHEEDETSKQQPKGDGGN